MLGHGDIALHHAERSAHFVERAGDEAAKLKEQEIIHTMKTLGTAFMADVQNHMGGLPVRNFSVGRLVDADLERLSGETRR